MDLVPWWVFGGSWRHMEVPHSPGMSQALSNGVCVSAEGRENLGRQPGCSAWWGRSVTITNLLSEANSSASEALGVCHPQLLPPAPLSSHVGSYPMSSVSVEEVLKNQIFLCPLFVNLA